MQKIKISQQRLM